MPPELYVDVPTPKYEPKLGIPIKVVGHGKNKQPIFESELAEQQKRREGYRRDRKRPWGR